MEAKPVHSLDGEIDYLGWSGFHIQPMAGRHILIDPPKGAIFPEAGEMLILITHGHPEHLGGVLDYIRAPVQAKTDRPATRIFGSPTVVHYLSRQCRRPDVIYQALAPGEELVLTPDIALFVFAWRHMPLLPPGFGAALRHVYHLAKGFRAAARIIAMSLRGPRGPGKMLGYLLRIPGGRSFIVYGEGLHRHSRIAEVEAVGRRAPGAALLVACEPEDVAELPRLVRASGAAAAFLYEPHRPWRDIFSLPHADLAALQREISATGIATYIGER